MIPGRELQELAQALLKTSEYSEMIKSRKKILDNPLLSKQMLEFEKEQIRILNSNMPNENISEQLKRLRVKYRNFIEHSDVGNFINAANACQKMIDNCCVTLNKAIEIHNNGYY